PVDGTRRGRRRSAAVRLTLATTWPQEGHSLIVARAVLARQSGCPREESNLRTRFRKPLLFPLSYGGERAGIVAEKPAGFIRVPSGSEGRSSGGEPDPRPASGPAGDTAAGGRRADPLRGAVARTRCGRHEGDGEEMADLSRRQFIGKGSIGVAAGVAALTPGSQGADAEAGGDPRVAPAEATPDEPGVAYAKRGAHGEVRVMVGSREVVQKDAELARRIIRASKS